MWQYNSLRQHILLLVPPVRAKIVRELSHFTAGDIYNLTCQVGSRYKRCHESFLTTYLFQVLGSRPSALTKMWVGERQLNVVSTKVNAIKRLLMIVSVSEKVAWIHYSSSFGLPFYAVNPLSSQHHKIMMSWVIMILEWHLKNEWKIYERFVTNEMEKMKET